MALSPYSESDCLSGKTGIEIILDISEGGGEFSFHRFSFYFHPVIKSYTLVCSNLHVSWVQVAHACNLSYSGDRDQEDHSLKPAQANSSKDSILKKKKSQKRAGGVAQGAGPEFKPQCRERKHSTYEI
jgi:hypothetical protein